MTNPVEAASHSHPADDYRIEAICCRAEMKLIAEASHDKPAQILASLVPQLPDAARALLPDNESTKRSLRYIRSKN